MYDQSTAPTIAAAARSTLSDIAERAQSEPYFLARVLAQHRERFGLTQKEQYTHLGVMSREWSLFQLCRSPEVDPKRWAEVLDEICTRFGADREKLERVLRGGE